MKNVIILYYYFAAPLERNKIDGSGNGKVDVKCISSAIDKKIKKIIASGKLDGLDELYKKRNEILGV